MITFFCCWTPFHLRNLLRVLNVHLHDANCQFLDDLANIGMQFALWRLSVCSLTPPLWHQCKLIKGAAANSVVNPFIYSFLSTQFRQKLAQVLERKIRRRKYNWRFFPRSHGNLAYDLDISYMVYNLYMLYIFGINSVYFVKDIFLNRKCL